MRVSGGFEVTTGGAEVVGGVTIEDEGLRVDSGGINITAGGLDIEHGGANITGGVTVGDGGLTVSAGGANISGGARITGGLEVMSGGLGVLDGGIDVQGGQVGINVDSPEYMLDVRARSSAKFTLPEIDADDHHAFNLVGTFSGTEAVKFEFVSVTGWDDNNGWDDNSPTGPDANNHIAILWRRLLGVGDVCTCCPETSDALERRLPVSHQNTMYCDVATNLGIVGNDGAAGSEVCTATDPADADICAQVVLGTDTAAEECEAVLKPGTDLAACSYTTNTFTIGQGLQLVLVDIMKPLGEPWTVEADVVNPIGVRDANGELTPSVGQDVLTADGGALIRGGMVIKDSGLVVEQAGGIEGAPLFLAVWRCLTLAYNSNRWLDIRVATCAFPETSR